MSFFSFVELNNFLCVDGKSLVWIDNHTEKTRVCLFKEKNQIFNKVSIA